MDKRSLRVLEFDTMLKHLSGYATSDPGRDLCLKLSPSKNRRYILFLQAQTTDARKLMALKGRAVSCGGLKDPGDIVSRLRAAAPLSAGELLTVKRILEIAREAKSYIGDAESSLSDIALILDPLSGISQKIERAVIDEYTIADDASPELAAVRRKIKKTAGDIRDSMSQKLNSLREFLSDAVITERDERYCLPVKSEFKSRVPGIVHGSSQTGLTLFIEPMSVVNLNNELIRLRGDEEREIERVLMELSRDLMPHTDTVLEDFKLLTRLDMIFAKALMAEDQNAEEPVFSLDRSIDLREARHPFIPADEVVAVDIRLGDTFSTLVVTGPNTGGKTVSLKTLGLLTLMAQAGLHIPARPGSKVGIYDEVYADIGDEQSIEQSLSTFSSHMTNIAKILKECDEKSLCLFDELGSGTDPTEGAALGIAILGYLTGRGVNTMATTHYAEIKVFALATEGIENASAEFDADSLRPTFRLLIGVPGQSNAFLISERLGLDKDIIRSARANLSRENEDLEALIRDLNEQRVRARKLSEEAQALRDEAAVLRDRAREREKKVSESREKALNDARKEARRILKNAKTTADSVISQMRKEGKDGNIREAEKERDKLRIAIDEAAGSEGISQKGPSRPVSPKTLKVGDSVRVTSLGGALGEVVSLCDKNNNIMVRVGAMLSRVPVSGVEYP